MQFYYLSENLTKKAEKKANTVDPDQLFLLLCWCFTALLHFSGHFERGQLPIHTVPGKAS